MSQPKDILLLLDEEAALLRARRFDQLESVSQRISKAVQTLQPVTNQKDLEIIRKRANENARLLMIMSAAVGGLKNRLQNLVTRENSVGYYPDGTRIAFDEKNSSSRM
ncbi:hypothetical protein [Parvularcula sp. LCG005]|uniref:hypothetical protein n=1 Tax=Parvularcula sp. LCG005 TaxID=3078805 RepID=UPI0029431FCF|nr:hypothetical protein [Parvularcula sp. LCG005]WOI52683.1 hypothetical protein RUI03_11050 [Parvularcula sp. LCG005]